ncbi:MAG: hypothetical protein E7Z65_06425 [Thermoplasmata archaeon]|nr:hypothetical protein [Thermoplasmata archaeon]
MTTLIETICLAEGMPLTASPSSVINACRIRKETKRKDIIDLSTTISNLVLCGFSEKPDPTKAIRHLFTDEEWNEMMAEQEEHAEQVRQEEMVARLMRM